MSDREKIILITIAMRICVVIMITAIILVGLSVWELVILLQG